MIRRVLVANRGEIAVRVIKACHALGIEAVLAVSVADKDSLGARLADDTVLIGPAPASESYLRAEAVVTAALGKRCDAIHPGYGFLSEDQHLAQLCADSDIVFVGPDASSLSLFGDKLTARRHAVSVGVPVLPASEPVQGGSVGEGVAEAVGYPLIIKAAAGGGGRGMRLVTEPASLPSSVELAAAEAQAAFGNPTVYLERFVAAGRHIEVQVVADAFGTVVHVGDRDCTVQRRHQKLIEEAPAAGLAPELQSALRESAVQICRSAGYRGVGTVEFLVDAAAGEYYFLEVNPRIQVEHGVSELVSGIDLVATQLRIASGEPLGLSQREIILTGSAIECRINAEDPLEGFRPSPGRITAWRPPAEGPDVRVDTHCFEGYLVPPYYDSLIAKILVRGADRDEAILAMERALGDLVVEGVRTTRAIHQWILAQEEFRHLTVTTPWLDAVLPHAQQALLERTGLDTTSAGGTR
ncbi:MAG: Pyruvate carboxylase [Actinotalea sp.]|nr:Pyruvate carboxylase [Actinotalea sp.]